MFSSVETWLVLVVALGLFLLAAWAHYVFWVRRFAIRLDYAEQHRLPTPDGSLVEIRRLRPPTAPKGSPVLLVHGVGASHRNLDFTLDRSLARYLHADGRDVWLLTLRSGRSDRRFTERRLIRFSRMATFDLPCAVEAVLERTGSKKLDYVGFSMGGMLLYASLGRALNEELVRRAVLIGAPGRVVTAWRALRFMRWIPAWLLPSLRLRFGARMLAFAAEWVTTPLHDHLYNSENVRPGTAARAMVNLVEDIPGTLQSDFNRWALTDGVVRVDGEPILDGLASIRVPALFFAGALDRLAPPAAVRLAFEAWGSRVDPPTKEIHVLSHDNGARADYGHGDLAIGTHLGEDLHGPLVRFLGS